MLIAVREHRKNTIISYFIAQNLGNNAKPRDHVPGYFRFQKYPGYEVKFHLPSSTFHSMKNTVLIFFSVKTTFFLFRLSTLIHSKLRKAKPRHRVWLMTYFSSFKSHSGKQCQKYSYMFTLWHFQLQCNFRSTPLCESLFTALIEIFVMLDVFQCRWCNVYS